MNPHWRDVLRYRALTSVRIHRKPSSLEEVEPTVPVPVPSPVVPTFPQHLLPAFVPSMNGTLIMQHLNMFRHYPRPYIHIIVKKQFAEPWMTEHASSAPAHWLDVHGFYRMEHFDIKVSIACAEN